MSDLPEHLLRILGADSETELTILPGNENENRLVKAGGKYFVVKKLHTGNDAELEGVYRQVLAKNGFPVAPFLYLNEKAYVLAIGKDKFVATQYVKGRTAKPKKQVVSAAGTLLAKIHSLSTNELPNRPNWFSRSYMSNALNAIDDAYDDYSKAFAAQLSEYPDFWNIGLPRGITHGDLHADNLIVDNKDNIVSIVDWEETGVEPLLLDVAHAAQQFSFEQGACNEELFHVFLSAYQSIRPLTDLEKSWFESALRYTMLALSVWASIKISRNEMSTELFQKVGNYFRASYTIPHTE